MIKFSPVQAGLRIRVRGNTAVQSFFVYSPGHPNEAACCENYADLLRQMGRETEARRLEARLLPKS